MADNEYGGGPDVKEPEQNDAPPGSLIGTTNLILNSNIFTEDEDWGEDTGGWGDDGHNEGGGGGGGRGGPGFRGRGGWRGPRGRGMRRPGFGFGRGFGPPGRGFGPPGKLN